MDVFERLKRSFMCFELSSCACVYFFFVPVIIKSFFIKKTPNQARKT